MARAIEAIRQMPEQDRPKKIYGCEVWRGLDWVSDEVGKVVLPVSDRPELAETLLGSFPSQNQGKRYDLGTLGRRKANATFSASHGLNEADDVTYALDLMPLIENPQLTLEEFLQPHLDRMRDEVMAMTGKCALHPTTEIRGAERADPEKERGQGRAGSS